MRHIVVLITTKDTQEAQKISRVLIEKKLAACVNIVKDVKSLFWWEGKVDEADEVLLIAKSREDIFEEIKAQVKASHSYSVPEIIALPIIDGNDEYLKWLEETTTK